MKKLTERIIGLHFMTHNSDVIDTTHNRINFPYLTRQFKSANSDKSEKTQPVLSDDNKKFPQPQQKQTNFLWVTSEKKLRVK